MARKLLLIDGHSIINRAFYGLPDLTNAEGKHTGAVYGFLTILFRFIDEEKPDGLAVMFDVHTPTFRHKIFAEYKGKRKPMPTELREQIPLLKEVLDAMGVRRFEQAGLEADDLLGTAAKTSEAAGWDVTIVSGDRDLLQVADERIIVAQPKTVRGVTTVTRYDEAAVAAEWGVSGERFIELKALMGDTSDNIPGLPKVGEKTAKELMAQFGSGDEIFARADEIKKKALRETVQAHRADYDLSKTLATIDLRAPFAFSPEEALFPGGDHRNYFTPEAYEVYKRLGFRKLLSMFSQEAAAGAGSVQKTTDATQADKETAAIQPATDSGTALPPVVCRTGKEAENAFAKAAAAGSQYIGISHIYDRKIDQPDAQLEFVFGGNDDNGLTLSGLGIWISDEEAPFYLAVGGEISPRMIREKLSALSGEKALAVFGAKESYAFFTPARILYEDAAELPQMFDIKIAAYLLNPLVNDLTPEDVAAAHLGITVRSRAEIFGKRPFTDLPEEAAAYGAQTARIAGLSAPVLAEKLSEEGMRDLFEMIEMPLSYILYDMERLGIRVRRDELRAYGEQLSDRIGELEKKIHTAAGAEFNINSPKQLGEILFEKMGMTGGKKTKTGYSTAADVLEKLAEEHPIVRDILEYRGLVKLKGTYADGLSDFIGTDGRIHTSFHQTVTATGRISSSDPNLQNIPMRTELGRAIRRVFVPADGCTFADADYSQIELRILAAMSGDAELIAAYHEGRDIHAITASRVFGVPFDQVTPLMRRNAKAVNFGIVYGISSFGLSQNIDISRSEAADYIKQYFATYPGVKAFLDALVQSARDNGYAETLYHRRRPVPELASSNFLQRSFGERVAMNAPIQGTAADIMKIAMIRVWKRLRDEDRRSRLILQIHDELLIETAAGEEEAVRQILVEEMMHSASLAVPLEVDCHFGTDWFEAK
ncbi:MAG: DNA polymerase I [Lachnospiraceae bacterium]|nr:DNA polymerase I [Lachnospiraceae bacterium]